MGISVVKPFTIGMFLLAASIVPAAAQQANGQPPRTPAPPFTLMSTSFSDVTTIPTQYTCSATTPPAGPRGISTGISPALQWANPPKGTVSFVLMLHDPDARRAKELDDITHWIIFNIPADATQLPENVKPSVPMADGTLQGKNTMGLDGFNGPCAGPGNFHHYTFWLLALDEKLDLPMGASRADIEKAMEGHVLGNAAYVGLFHR